MNYRLGDETQEVTEAIDIHFDEDEGHLWLDCDDGEFVYIRDLIVFGASAADRLSPFIDGLRSIAVRQRTAVWDPTPRQFRRWSLTLLVSFALSVTVAIQVIGIVAIARWILRHGAY